MKYLIFIITLMISECHVAIAQQSTNYYPDSVRIEIPEKHTLVVFQFRSVDKIKPVLDNFPSQFKTLLTHIGNSMPKDFSNTGPYTIDIHILPESTEWKMEWVQEGETNGIGEKVKMTIQKDAKASTDVLIKEERIVELLPPGWKLNIDSKNYKVSIYTETYDELVNVAIINFNDANNIIKEDDAMKSLGRKSVYARLSYGNAQFKKNTINLHHPGDNIFLTAIGGVGMVRDKIYPELSFKLGLTFNDHFSRSNIRTSLLYNNLFITENLEGKYTTFSNGFLSLHLEHNFNPRKGNPHWTGFGVGMLTRKRGDYFTGNTMKMFITHEFGGKVNIVPEFYLTNNLKTFVFGTTIRYAF